MKSIDFIRKRSLKKISESKFSLANALLLDNHSACFTNIYGSHANNRITETA